MGDQIRGAFVGVVLAVLSVGVFIVVPWLWAIPAGALVWWCVAQERKIKNPSPTEAPEGVDDEESQFSVHEDRPGHCAVEWPEGADIRDGEDSNE